MRFRNGTVCGSLNSRIVFLVELVLCGGMLAGCGQWNRSVRDRADVVIQITYDGQPLTSGDVDLNNLETGEGGGGTLDETGTVKIAGVILGDYVVTVQPPSPGAIPGEIFEPMDDKLIPPIFRSPMASPLKITVEPEGVDVSFELKQ